MKARKVENIVRKEKGSGVNKKNQKREIQWNNNQNVLYFSGNQININ